MLDIVLLIPAIVVVVALGAASALRAVIASVLSRRTNKQQSTTTTGYRMTAPAPKTTVFAQGSLLVTGDGSLVIDEIIPSNRAILANPDAYVVVQFDPTVPPPPPCANTLPDEVDWELFFTHVHDTHLNPNEPAEQLKLKIEWRCATSRTVVWQILVPAS